MRKQLVLALCLWLVTILVIVCNPAQNVPSSSVPTPAHGQENVQVTIPIEPIINATSIIVSMATSTLAPSLVPMPTAIQARSATPTLAWRTTQLLHDGSRLPALKGKMVSFQNGTLKIEIEPGKTLDLVVNEGTAGHLYLFLRLAWHV